MKTDIKYWEFYPCDDEDITRLMHAIRGKIRLDLHKHSCMSYRYPKLEVGKRYYLELGNSIWDLHYELIQINFLHKGVAFFTIVDTGIEDHLEEGCLGHMFMEPEELVVPYDPEYYEVISRSGKMRVIYEFTGYPPSTRNKDEIDRLVNELTKIRDEKENL